MLVESAEDGQVHTRVLTRGALLGRKGINVTHARPSLPAITEKDRADLAIAVEQEADFVALSFVRSAADVGELAGYLRELGSTARTIAKIEKVEAYEHLDEIMRSANGVMVARGDYGVEAGVARVPLMQKDTIHRATEAGRLVITATHMLESMIGQPEPTRAEATDVANAVIDGTSAVMLSAETSVGAHPVEAVLMMSQIAEAAEEAPVIHAARPGPVEPEGPDAAVMHAAVSLAGAVDAVALIVPTSSGSTPRACAKFRPPPDHRARLRAPGRRPARARVGRPPDDDGRLAHRRRAHRHRAPARSRLRRAAERRLGGAHRGAARRARRDEPDHAARAAVAAGTRRPAHARRASV